uniref:Carbohydrate ABC transporter permease n=1 Tax=Ascaris lumbricoides TaxID=6252 RepID=A0A0M3IJQ3_ASCLU
MGRIQFAALLNMRTSITMTAVVLSTWLVVGFLAPLSLSYSLVTLRDAPAPLLRRIRASDDDGEMLLAKPWSGYYLPKQPITALSPWLTLEENGPFFI